ncbi:uncharacterized protein LOC115795323 [Archocentrus centrarchus]|uniref:uncharacterized protein LOC115795323 n=1 Tax=Archocentrus centrarchus TaxID=63155 RepID=UPI0011EA0CE2|nr:uncharacterized protein LOC115795323 [Archocentrus centrarchus]
MVFHWILRLIFMLLVKTGLVAGCVCPAATILSQFPLEVPVDVCCLNYSGSDFSHVPWSVFTNKTNIETLDLSNCNMSSLDINDKEAPRASALQKVYLSHNRLKMLPGGFLASHPSLKELDLSGNLLQEFPEDFLKDSNNLQKLYLQENQLRFLPNTILQMPMLQKLELDGNHWDCSCLLLEGLEARKEANHTIKLQDLLGNMTCFSPWHLEGRTVLSVRLTNVCRPPGLTALFIVLPLLILSALLLCWCCGRTKKKKEVPTFSSSKKRSHSSSCNGQKHRSKQQPSAPEQGKAGQGILKNQLLLRPASTLLGSTRDIYEEVEIKLGSVESLPRVSSCRSSSTEERQGSQEPDGASKTELDTESVTEVLKDSADREKAYMTQSTEYYSLVPGIELEDSDHGEYENVDLS